MKFDNTYKSLPAQFYSKSKASEFHAPKLLGLNKNLATELGFEFTDYSDDELAQIFSGQKNLEGSDPIAMVYAAHQFGHFVPQLGDGRALLLGEVLNKNNERFDLQLKGSGRTAYSRNGDGLSALGPVVREYIVSEAMHHLGVPTTRALAAIVTGDLVYRETPTPGGVFTRVASSHIRVGTFQFFANQPGIEGVKTLLDYAVKRHYSFLNSQKTEDKSMNFLKAVIEKQIELVTHWMALGFIHGVMNTDNMTISGETIDFGPCAFMDKFHYQKVFSSIDRNGRYAYANQGPILAWNMARLADCLVPLVHHDETEAIEMLTHELSTIEKQFTSKLNERMSAKIGLDSDDVHIVKLFLTYLEKEQIDFTLGFRNLGDSSWYKQTSDFKKFEDLWKKTISDKGKDFNDVIIDIKKINPLYIPRNHQVENAIQQANIGNFTIFNEMNEVLLDPFKKHDNLNQYSLPPTAEEEVTATFCGT